MIVLIFSPFAVSLGVAVGLLILLLVVGVLNTVEMVRDQPSAIPCPEDLDFGTTFDELLEATPAQGGPGPCPACSAGDWQQEYHQHNYPPQLSAYRPGGVKAVQ